MPFSNWAVHNITVDGALQWWPKCIWADWAEWSQLLLNEWVRKHSWENKNPKSINTKSPPRHTESSFRGWEIQFSPASIVVQYLSAVLACSRATGQQPLFELIHVWQIHQNIKTCLRSEARGRKTRWMDKIVRQYQQMDKHFKHIHVSNKSEITFARSFSIF